MKTVKDFKAKGGVIVTLDVIGHDTERHGTKRHVEIHDAEYHNKVVSYDDYSLKSFAWRTNTGVKPEFVGDVECKLRNGVVTTLDSTKCDWDIDVKKPVSDDIIKWRPHLPLSIPTETPEEKEALDAIEQKSPYDVDAHVSGEEYIPNKPSPYPDVDAHCSEAKSRILGRIPAQSSAARECESIPEVKPTFTQAMADAGELPPVGSECLVKSGSLKEWFKGLCVGFDGNFILFRMGEDYPFNSVYCGFELRRVKPIQTEREKAIDELAPILEELIGCQEFEDGGCKWVAGQLYDAGYRKC